METKKAIQREHLSDTYVIGDEHGVHEVPVTEFNELSGIDGVIRIQSDEFDWLLTHPTHLTHFNLQVCYHVPGRAYALPRIIERGYFVSPDNEKPPVLSFTDNIRGECTHVREHVNYDELTEADFEHSFPHIKNVEELKHAIVKRYTKSLPALGEDEILSLGVSLTELELRS